MITSRFPMSQPRFIAAVNSDCEKSFAEGNEQGEAGLALNLQAAFGRWGSGVTTLPQRGCMKWEKVP